MPEPRCPSGWGRSTRAQESPSHRAGEGRALQATADTGSNPGREGRSQRDKVRQGAWPGGCIHQLRASSPWPEGLPGLCPHNSAPGLCLFCPSLQYLRPSLFSGPGPGLGSTPRHRKPSQLLSPLPETPAAGRLLTRAWEWHSFFPRPTARPASKEPHIHAVMGALHRLLHSDAGASARTTARREQPATVPAPLHATSTPLPGHAQSGVAWGMQKGLHPALTPWQERGC